MNKLKLIGKITHLFAHNRNCTIRHVYVDKISQVHSHKTDGPLRTKKFEIPISSQVQ